MATARSYRHGMAVDINQIRSAARRANDGQAIYHDFRAHNERRAHRARLLEAQRLQRIERMRQLVRKRKLDRD
ncbi:MAG TPA: hypothetical protein VFW09_10350 [Solirubrobacteraceae bacterium]|nr:hypothetical protein [Solirubrobacteraceae bacterium]